MVAPSKFVLGLLNMRTHHEHPPITDEEKELIIKSVLSSKDYQDNPKGVWTRWRDLTAIRLTIAAGLRPGEALNLKWEDIDFENSEIKISANSNKQRCDKPATLSNTAKEALMDFATVCDDLGIKFDYIFPSLETYLPVSTDRFGRIIQHAAKEAGILKVIWTSEHGQPHYNVSGYTGRRYFGTTVFRRTRSDIAVKELMRHSCLASSQPYIKLNHIDKKQIIDAVFNKGI